MIGGSGGGVLIVWMISYINCFKVVVVFYFVINWESFNFMVDIVFWILVYWFLGMFWDYVENY